MRKTTFEEDPNEAVTAPERLDTLRQQEECPLCGSPMEKDDPMCEECGYLSPPEGLDDPDLTKAREFDRSQDRDNESTEAPEEDDEQQQQPKRKERERRVRGPRSPRRVRTNARNTINQELQEGNSRMRTKNKKSRICLSARVESIPTKEDLRKMGWTYLATPDPKDRSEKTLVEDGRAASDEPKDKRVKSDQAAPVTSRRRRPLRRKSVGESTEDTGVGPSEDTPQNSEDSKDLQEVQPGESKLPQGGGDHKAPEEKTTPQNSEDSKDINEHQPGTQSTGQGGGKLSPPPTVTEPMNHEDAAKMKEHHPEGIPGEEPTNDASNTASRKRGDRTIRREEIIENEGSDIGDDEGEASYDDAQGYDSYYEANSKDAREPVLISAMRLADLEIELGLQDKEAKYERIAKYEEEGMDAINARMDSLNQVKSSGLTNKKSSSAGSRLPSLRQAHVSNNGTNGNEPEVPDEAVFGS